MRGLSRRIRYHRSQNNVLQSLIRYKSSVEKSTIIGAALPPDDDELSSYAYYNSKLNKPTISSSTVTKSSPTTNRLTRIFSKDNITVSHSYNRWLIPPAALAVHLSIGSVYAWSIFNSPLTRELGVVAAAPGMYVYNNVYLIIMFTVCIYFALFVISLSSF